MITNRTQILIVDDDYSTRRLMERYIRNNWMCQVSQAADGSEALKQMLRELPDLVILDLVMPFMTGIQVLETMRKTTRLAGIPVLACTSVDDNAVVKKIIEYGLVDYLIKPVQEALMVEKVNKVFAS